MGKLLVRTIASKAPGRHSDGDGLSLLVKPTGRKSWVLRLQRYGKRQDIGLGTVDTSVRSADERRASDAIPILTRRHLTLAEAREKAEELRRFGRAGRDPLVERDRERREIPSFKEAAVAAHAALSAEWESKNATAFLRKLENHAYPTIGDVRIDEIDSAEIIDVLHPIWRTKPAMARKVRQHITQVLNFAKSKNWRATEAPNKSVSAGLSKQPEGSNFKAMPYDLVPAFVAETLAKRDSGGRLALLLVILAPCRPGEARRTRWSDFDLEKGEWNRPAAIMKGGKAHTITLNRPAVALLQRLKDERSPKPGDLVFPGKNGEPLSDMTLNRALATANQPYHAHGFRSAFRDWAAEMMPNTPDAVVKNAMGHLVKDKVDRAYLRAQYKAMRRELLEAWGAFLTGTDRVSA